MKKIKSFLSSKKNLRILITRTDRIGDVVLSIPLIKILRDHFPGSFIGFLCRPYTRDILEGNPYLNEVLVYDKYGRHRTFGGSLEFLKRLRLKKFDIAIILHPTNRMHLLCFLAGIPLRIGYDRKLGFLNSLRLPHRKQSGRKSELEYNLEFLDILGIEDRDIEFFIPLRKAQEAAAEEILEAAGFHRKDFIVAVNPTASCPSKVWPARNFAGLVNRLITKTGCKVILIGSKDKASISQALKQGLNHEVLDLSGKTDILLLSSVLKRVNLLVSCDSGPVHIANALGKRCIVIFGRNQPGLSWRRWAPYGEGHIIFHKDVGCKECLAHNCLRDFLCLRSIGVEEVEKACLNVISSYRR